MPAPGSVSPARSDAASDPDARARKRQRLLRSFAADRERRKQAIADAREERETMRAACAKSRMTLRKMTEARSLVRTAADGSRTYLSEKERALALAGAARHVNDSCS